MKIVVMINSKSVAVSIMESFADALKRNNNEVLKIYLKKNEIFDNQMFKSVSEFSPDFILGYAYTPMLNLENGPIFRSMGIKAVMLHFDCPFVNFHDYYDNEFKKYPEYYFNFIWDDYFLEIFKAKGYQNCDKTYLAVDTNKFYHMDIKPKKAICFAGSMGKELLESYTNSDIVNEFIDEVLEKKLWNIGIPTLNICFELFKRKKYMYIREMWEKDNASFWKPIYMILAVKGSTVLREGIINSIDGEEVHIYGTGNSVKKTQVYHDSVSHGHDMAKIYQEYKLNLNIASPQLETSLNNRIFDIFAAKGFVLSDYKSDIKKLFPDYCEYISFKNFEELGEKGDYFLNHDIERNEIIEGMHESIIRNHTYDIRSREIIQTLKDNNFFNK